MKTVLKYILKTLILIIGVFLITLLIAAWQVDEKDLKKWISEAARERFARELEIQGDLKLDLLTLKPQVIAHDIRFENAKWAEPKDMLSLKTFTLQLNLLPILRGDIEVLNFVLANGELHLVKEKDRANWDALTTTIENQADSSTADQERGSFFSVEKVSTIKVHEFVVNYRDIPANQQHSFAIGQLSGEDLLSANRNAVLKGSLDEIPLGLKLAQEPAKDSATADRLFSVRGHMGKANGSFSGNISDDFKNVEGLVRMHGPGETLTEIVNLFGLDLESLRDLDGVMKIDSQLTEPRISLSEIDFNYGKSEARGNMSLELRDAVAVINGNLTFPRLTNADLDSLGKKELVKEVKEEVTDIDPEAKEQHSEQRKLFDTNQISPFIPKNLNVNVLVIVSEFVGNNWSKVIHGGRGRITLADQELTLSPVIIRTLGGSLAANGRIKQQEPQFTGELKVRVDNVEIRQVAEELANLDKKLNIDKIAGGSVDAVADISFKGGTPDEIASNLNGDLQFVIEEGYIGSMLVEALQLDVTEIFGSWLADNPKTDINCMIADFAIKSGNIISKSVFVQTTDSDVMGKGNINLAKETVDFGIIAKSNDFSITGTPILISAKGDLIKPKLELGGSNSLLEIAGEAVVAPVVNTYKEVFGDEKDSGPRICGRFKDNIARIQQRAQVEQRPAE